MGGMNYNRRSTRPDSVFYCDTRKMRSPSGRGRRFHPVPLALLIFALAMLIWWFFKKS